MTPFLLFAIVSGHISRSICRRSQGLVTGDGHGSRRIDTGIFVVLHHRRHERDMVCRHGPSTVISCSHSSTTSTNRLDAA